MAVTEGQIVPKLGPDSRPIRVMFPGNNVGYWCKLTLTAGSTYSSTDRIRFDHGVAGSVQQMLGTLIIKQIMFSNGFSLGGVSTGEAKGEWLASTQQLSLRRIGTAAPGTGPQDESEFNGVGIGAGIASCEALVLV